MNTIDLTTWCDTYREYIKAPWSLGDYSYATNGHVLIRVPRRDDAPDCNKELLSKVNHNFDVSPAEWLPIPEVSPQKIDCDECNGTGEYICHTCDHNHGDCENCDGTGKVQKRTPVTVGNTLFSDVYLAMIAALPGAQIGVQDYPNASRFRFDGGDGLIMPMRP